MAKIIAFGERKHEKSQKLFERNLQTEIEEVEKRLGIPEDEPLLVLTDMNALTVGNCLLDAKKGIKEQLTEIDRVLEILGIDESEVFPGE